MAQPAIRNTDVHLCPSHGGDKVGAVAPLDITVNSDPAVHVGLGFTCGGQPAQVTTGASTVRYHGEFAARAFDDSGHGGKLLIGSGNVVIGGPTGMGCIGAGKKMCAKAAEGRTSGSKKQSYGNCVLECVRQLVQRSTGRAVSEDEMMAHALQRPDVTNTPGNSHAHGGANGEIGRAILEDFGVPAERMPSTGSATLNDVKKAVSEGRGIIAFVETDPWYGNPGPGSHAITVTGVELDANGNVVAVFVNDTGANGDNCGQRVPVDRFEKSLNANGSRLLVTKGAMS